MTNRLLSNLTCLALCILSYAPLQAQFSTFSTPRFVPNKPGAYDTLGRKHVAELATQSGGLVEREVDPTTYILGAGDMLTIGIWTSEPLMFDVPVSPEGKVVIPRVGMVSVKDLTLEEGVSAITSKIKSVFRTSAVDVTLKRLRQFKVYVLGAVRSPAVVPATPADRVFDVIQKSGGVLDTGSVRAISIVRDDEPESIPVDLERYLSYGDNTHNPVLQGGDRIIVPLRNARSEVAISGEVFREGKFEWRQGDSLSTIVKFAGGFLPSASLDSVVLVRVSETTGEITEIILNLSSWKAELFSETQLAGDLPLQLGDRIYIRAVPKWLEKHGVAVAGEVIYPGKYAIAPEQTRVTDIIQRAGGFADMASIEDAVILRTSELQLEDKEFERLKRLPPSEMSKNELQYYKTKSREVKGIMSVDFRKLFLEGSLDNNPLLRDGDSIFVPQRNLYVNVTGSVRSPGRIVYKPGLNYLDYINLAGGYGFRADRNATFVVKVKGDQFPAMSENYKLEPGDNILVLDEPETRFIDVFTQVLTITAQIFTIVGIAITLTRLQ